MLCFASLYTVYFRVMQTLILAWSFIFGTVIGSFLNVVIFRLETGETLRGRSHCRSCGRTLAWYELAPLVSYIALRGVCRTCAARISPQYFLVEAATGVLFALAAERFFISNPILLAADLGIIAALVAIAAYDLRHMIIPDILVLWLSGFAVLYVGVETVTGMPNVSVLSALIGAIALAGFFAGLWLVSSGRWIGLGDAKLAAPLGFVLGWRGAVSMLMLSFWIGAVVSVGLLMAQRIVGRRGESQRPAISARGQSWFPLSGKPLTIASEVPFAPFLIAAYLLVHLFGADVFVLTEAAIERLVF